jgi:large subunit ribosomal protein L29
MATEDMRMKTDDQLKTGLANMKKEAFNLPFQLASCQLENTARVRAVRRDVARIMTFLGKKAAVKGDAAPKAAKPAAPKAKKAAKPKAEAAAKAPKKPKTTTPKAKKAAAKKTAKAKA